MRLQCTFRAPAAAAGVVMALVVASPAAAQWSSDPAVNNAVGIAPNVQYQPAMVTAGDGGSIVVWNDSRSGTQAIYGQRFDAAGFAQWNANGLALVAPFAINTAEMSAVSDGGGGVIVVWFDSHTGPVTLNAQRFAANGSPQWNAGGVIVASGMDIASMVALVSDGAGGADMVWSALGAFNSNNHLYAQRIDATGQPVWSGPVSVSTDVTLNSRPQVDTDGSGGLVVSWASRLSITLDVFAQRIDATGARRWGDAGVAAGAAGSERKFPGIAGDVAGGAVVVWQQGGSFLAQHFDGDGTSLWTPAGLLLTGAHSAFQDTVCADGAGGAYVSYFGDSMRVQHVTGAGTLPWGATGPAIKLSGGTVFWHPMVRTPDGGVIVGWSVFTLIAAQSIGVDGQLRWGNGVMVSTSNSSHTYPALVADTYQGATFAWADNRNDPGGGFGNPDLYAQHVAASGTLDVPIFPDPSHAISLALASVPSPARGGSPVQLRFALPADGRVRLALYDVSGRLVRVLVDGNESMGWRAADWDGRDNDGVLMPAGVYLARLMSTSGVADARVVRLP